MLRRIKNEYIIEQSNVGSTGRYIYQRKLMDLLQRIVELYRRNATVNVNDLLNGILTSYSRLLGQIGIQFQFNIPANIPLNHKVAFVSHEFIRLKQNLIDIYRNTLPTTTNVYTQRTQKSMINRELLVIENSIMKTFYRITLESLLRLDIRI